MLTKTGAWHPFPGSPDSITDLDWGSPAMDDERLILIRQVRQRLEALRRAGLDRIPRPPDRPAPPRRVVTALDASEDTRHETRDTRHETRAVAAPDVAPPPVRPAAPAP